MLNPRADQIHDQAEHGEGDRLVEPDVNRGSQACQRLETDHQRDHTQDYCARVAVELSELAGTKG
jgi:hypothetical protein